MARKARDIRAALYTVELIPRGELKSRVHVKNVNWKKEIADPSTDPVIVLSNRYLAMVRSGKYDLVKLGECYHRALMAYVVDKIQNTVEVMIKCYGSNQ